MEQNIISEEQIPYAILQQFGLSRDMIEDLPFECLQDIQNCRISEVLPLTINDGKGNIIKVKSRICLNIFDDDRVDVFFFPELQRSELKGFNEKENQALLQGETIKSNNIAGAASPLCFVQIDSSTKQVLYVPSDIIDRNISCFKKSFNVSDEDIKMLHGGRLLTLRYTGMLVTAGIDLTEQTGLHIVQGDAFDWQRTRQNHEKYTFGVAGCWIRDDDGNLDRFVYEYDYTDELREEFEKAIARNSSQKR